MLTVDLGALRVDVRGFCRLLLAAALCLLLTAGLASPVGALPPGNDVRTVHGAPSFVCDGAANDARLAIPHRSGSLGEEAPRGHGVKGLSNAVVVVYDPADFVAPNGLVKPWRNGAGELTNGSYTVFGARQAKHTTGNLSDGASQFFYRVDDEALTLDAAAYADQMGLWVDNKAKVYVDELIGVTGDGTPTHWINVYRRDLGGQVAPYLHGSPGNPPS